MIPQERLREIAHIDRKLVEVQKNPVASTRQEVVSIRSLMRQRAEHVVELERLGLDAPDFPMVDDA